MDPKKILAVDDDERVVTFIADILRAHGFDVVTAQSGSGAIRKTQKYRPDLIIMDLVMSDLDGAETVKILQQDPAMQHIPILFISGILAEEGGLHTNFKVGGASYTALAKPFKPHELLAAVAGLLER